MKTTIHSFLLAAAVAATMCMFSSCNPDIQLNADEDAPKIAEHVLGMRTEEAVKYLEQCGFVENPEPKAYRREFSKEPGVTNFSEDHSILLTIPVTGIDTVTETIFRQRVIDEQSAYKLYWKWSHYTAEVTLPGVERWNASLAYRDSTTNYVDGTMANRSKQRLEDAYKQGKIGKEQYEQGMANLARNREQFWKEYKSTRYNAAETYRNEGRDFPYKQIVLSIQTPDAMPTSYQPYDCPTLYYSTATVFLIYD